MKPSQRRAMFAKMKFVKVQGFKRPVRLLSQSELAYAFDHFDVRYPKTDKGLLRVRMVAKDGSERWFPVKTTPITLRRIA
jgi:hypothetical protein